MTAGRTEVTTSGERAESGVGDERPAPAAPAGPHEAVVGGERLGLVTGDLRCPNCAFNMRGQPIIREPHYKMVAVMCPECGTPTALTEYPRLGPWGRRLGTVAMVMVLLGLILGFVALGATVMGFTTAATMVAVEPVAEKIAEEFVDYAKSLPSPTTSTGFAIQYATQQAPSPDSYIDGAWWQQHHGDDWMSKVSPATRPFGRRTAVSWLQGAFVLLPWAAVLACAMPHRRGWKLLLIPIVVCAIGFVFMILAGTFSWASQRSWTAYTTASGCAQMVVPDSIFYVEFAIMLVPVVAGTYTGRPLARWLIRWLVPPRQYVAFGFLWAADGLAMPKA